MATLTFTATTSGSETINWVISATSNVFLTVNTTPSVSVSGNKSTAVVTYSVNDGYTIDQDGGALTCVIAAIASDKTGGSNSAQCLIKGRSSGGGGGVGGGICPPHPMVQAAYTCPSCNMTIAICSRGCGYSEGHALNCPQSGDTP